MFVARTTLVQPPGTSGCGRRNTLRCSAADSCECRGSTRREPELALGLRQELSLRTSRSISNAPGRKTSTAPSPPPPPPPPGPREQWCRSTSLSTRSSFTSDRSIARSEEEAVTAAAALAFADPALPALPAIPVLLLVVPGMPAPP